MTRTAESVRTLMQAADPLPPAWAAGCDSTLDDDLATLLARVEADPAEPDAEVWDLTVDDYRRPAPGHSWWAVPAVAAAAVLAVAVAITVAVTAGRGSHSAPAGELTSAASRSLTSQQSAEAAARSAAAEKSRARTAAEAQVAARTCAREVNATLRGMVSAYRHANGGKSAGLHYLESVHSPSTLVYTRDAAAFGDWLTRGGPTGTIDIESAVARACIQ